MLSNEHKCVILIMTIGDSPKIERMKQMDNKGKIWLIVIGFFLLAGLLSKCDTRTEEEKWKDSYIGAYEEYAEFYGWHQD